MLLVDAAVGEDDVVVTLVDAVLGIMAEIVESFLESRLALADLEDYRQFYGVEAFVTDVAEDIQLGVRQDRMRQAHHLTVALVRVEDACAYASNIFRETHDEVLTYGVDGRVRHLCELLTEVVEEYLRTVGEDSQRSVVTH